MRMRFINIAGVCQLMGTSCFVGGASGEHVYHHQGIQGGERPTGERTVAL